MMLKRVHDAKVDCLHHAFTISTKRLLIQLLTWLLASGSDATHLSILTATATYSPYY
jgi:hypothetical protein